MKELLKKKLGLLLFAVMALTISTPAQAQLGGLLKKAKEKATQKAVQSQASDHNGINMENSSEKGKKDQEKYANMNPTEGEVVDLGLPSGTLWASTNMGAAKPEESGDYYAWAETKTKEYFCSNHYIMKDGKGGTDLDPTFKAGLWTKGNIAGTQFDAATAVKGAPWVMPTKEQWQELISECKWVVHTINGEKGALVIGKNNNCIFIPTAGYKVQANYSNPKEKQTDTYARKTLVDFFYWTSSVWDDPAGRTIGAYAFKADIGRVLGGMNDRMMMNDQTERYAGLPIRPVRAK